ncbi:sugar kinase [Enterococcus sp. LJL90]
MRVAAFGEVMMRLSPPEYLLLEQTNQLRMDFTGSGVNILANLAHFGQEVSLLTALPDNRLGQAAAAHLRKLKINDDYLQFCHQHLGSYFAEMGYGARATQVTYQNRLSSSFGQSGPAVYPFSEMIANFDLFHICGISLSLTDQTRAAAQSFAEKIAASGKPICFDFNFRPSLNTEADKLQLMRQQYQTILPHCQIVFGSSRDLTDLLGIEQKGTEEEIIQDFMAEYQIELFAGTKKISKDGKQYVQGVLYAQDKKVTSPLFELQVLDRIGAGDAYAAGILQGYLEGWELEQTVNFATMNNVLAHTMHGDVPLTTEKDVWLALKHPEINLIR